MSRQGQILRGEKWYELYSKDGVLPDFIANDKNKMANVCLYLETLKKEEEVKDYPEENINLPPEERKPKPKSKEKK